MVFYDRPVYQEEYAAQLIMARRLALHTKAEYICADLSIALRFSLAVARRTIHSGKFDAVFRFVLDISQRGPYG